LNDPSARRRKAEGCAEGEKRGGQRVEDPLAGGNDVRFVFLGNRDGCASPPSPKVHSPDSPP